MKYCSKCGKELLDESVICTGCGCPVESTTKPKSYAYDTADKGLCVLSFLIPLFGFVYWLVKHNETPEKASRPFDTARDGFVIAEGSGMLILESEEHAKARGAKICCELSGYASNSNATDMVVPDVAASTEVMRLCLENAGLKPEDISYINTHGTSTGVGDPVELEAIGNVFGREGKVAINSTKSQTGHMIGAAGAVEAIFTSLMMDHAFISKSANLENVVEGFEWADLVKELREGVEIRHALSNSFGFGGTNASLILSKYE